MWKGCVFWDKSKCFWIVGQGQKHKRALRVVIQAEADSLWPSLIENVHFFVQVWKKLVFFFYRLAFPLRQSHQTAFRVVSRWWETPASCLNFTKLNSKRSTSSLFQLSHTQASALTWVSGTSISLKGSSGEKLPICYFLPVNLLRARPPPPVRTYDAFSSFRPRVIYPPAYYSENLPAFRLPPPAARDGRQTQRPNRLEM